MLLRRRGWGDVRSAPMRAFPVPWPTAYQEFSRPAPYAFVDRTPWLRRDKVSASMFAVSSPISPSRPGTLALWHAAAIVLAAMPLVMAIAHRSAALVIVLATVLALAAAAGERRVGAMLRDVVAVLWTPLGIASLAFLLFAALSIAWSPDPKTSLRGLIEFIVPIAGALALA